MLGFFPVAGFALGEAGSSDYVLIAEPGTYALGGDDSTLADEFILDFVTEVGAYGITGAAAGLDVDVFPELAPDVAFVFAPAAPRLGSAAATPAAIRLGHQ